MPRRKQTFADWQDVIMQDLMRMARGNDSPTGNAVPATTVFAKRLRCYRMRHSEYVVMGEVLV